MRPSEKKKKGEKTMVMETSVHVRIYVNMSQSVKVPNSICVPLNRNQRKLSYLQSLSLQINPPFILWSVYFK